MKKWTVLIVFLCILLLGALAGCVRKSSNSISGVDKYQPDWNSLAQWQIPQWFEDAVLGFYCHWGVYSVPGFAFKDSSERVDSGIWYGGGMYEPEGPLGVYEFHIEAFGDPCEFGYHDLIPLFKAEKWDPDRWANLYKEAGADFVGVCAEHADGFAMWDSELDKFNVMDMGPKRDLLGELFEAGRRLGMNTIATFHKAPETLFEAGFEFCPEDLNDPEFSDLYGEETADDIYNRLIEVIDKYQPDQMWFEGAEQIGMERFKLFLAYYYNSADGWGKEVVASQKDTEEKLLSCTALDVEGGNFPGGIWVWAGMEEPQKHRWQKDVPMGKFWAYAEGVSCRPVNMLVDGIVDRISKNGVTLLDVAPKADGTLPEAQIKGLQELGAWMKINKEALYAAKPAHFVEGGIDEWKSGSFRFMEKGDYLYAVDIGNEWPTELGFDEYTDSEIPVAPVVIPGAVPVEGSSVRMLGHDKDLPWHLEGDDLVIEELPDPLPCEHAWSFKIKI